MDTSERSAAVGLCHTQYWFLRRRGGWEDPPLWRGSSVTSLEFLVNIGGSMGGRSERWVPELSDSQRGITLKAGRLGGMEELGEVSLDLELSIQLSESERLAPTEV